MSQSQRITPFLTFKDQAEEAAEFYVSVIPDSKILRKVKNPHADAVLTVELELRGMKFVALNAGQDWKFTEAFSIAVECDTQQELDRVWESLTADGGAELACGWLKDKFGMFWQIWPAELPKWMASEDSEAVQRMFQAVWQMKKLDIATLEKAFGGGT
ncbi:VOC family protein [Pirellulaceae bacterium SH467]|jgi:predicted 3-demethylubiquinone-9 3-methyltransferase (glyoxalase superfamily)